MRTYSKLHRNEEGAATEIGYIFTFLLGLMLLSSFSIWVWDIETATQKRWTNEAIEENLFSTSEAIERADEAARIDPAARYAEPVNLHLSGATGLELKMWLTDDAIHIIDSGGEYSSSHAISGAAATTHSGQLSISGIDTIWVVLDQGEVTIQTKQPGF
ncbi:MAG: hypothetical protein QF440_00010 [Candidatus Thalassarchaeaceae archaeon]|jgi:hypothetical protein|nr:hypothetical protein [Candidatus Thalassarchaeaceae archaeon]